MGILGTVNNITSLQEIYYYTLHVGVVKLQSRSVLIQTLAFFNPSYDINNSKICRVSGCWHISENLYHVQVVPILHCCYILSWCYHNNRGLSISDGVCWVQPAISIRDLIGSRTNKQYEGVGKDVLPRGGLVGWGWVLDQTAIYHLVLVAMETNDYLWQHDGAHGM